MCDCLGTVPRNGCVHCCLYGGQALGLLFVLYGHRPKERLYCVSCLFGGQTLGLHFGLIGHRPYERLRVGLFGVQTLGLQVCLTGHRPQ